MCRDFPVLKESFEQEMKANLAGGLAEFAVTLCAHLRRLWVEQKFQEAAKPLCDYQLQKLDALKEALGVDSSASGSMGAKKKLRSGSAHRDLALAVAIRGCRRRRRKKAGKRNKEKQIEIQRHSPGRRGRTKRTGR